MIKSWLILGQHVQTEMHHFSGTDWDFWNDFRIWSGLNYSCFFFHTKWNTASFWKDMEFEFPNSLQKLYLFNDLCVNPLSWCLVMHITEFIGNIMNKKLINIFSLFLLSSKNPCILSPCLFHLYADYIMWNAGLDGEQAGIKIAGRNISNFRYTNDTTLMVVKRNWSTSWWKWKRRVKKLV